MANGFDVVTIRIENESGEVVGVVGRTKTGRTVVLAARLQGRLMEVCDLPAIDGGERQVKMGRPIFALEANAQRRDAAWATKLDTERPLRDNGYAQRFERLEKECFARRVVADAENDVVEHGFPEVCELHTA